MSTTFLGIDSTEIQDVLHLISEFDIDGIELGSTHKYNRNIEKIIKSECDKKIVTHNFFPPLEDGDFVVNIASSNEAALQKSVDYAIENIKFAEKIGATVYTVHPGFLATPEKQTNQKLNNYDFKFSEKKVTHDRAYATMLESLSELTIVASQHNVRLAIETEGSLTEPGVLLMERMEEYDDMFSMFPDNIYLNINLAHTRFASIEHKYKMNKFIKRYYNKIALAEISHNNGVIDQHLPLIDNSYVFDYLPLLPTVPHILEFRNATIDQVKHSIALVRKNKKKEN